MGYDQDLIPEQVSAVETRERVIAVLAGPGSGKTRVLSYRTRHLLQKHPGSQCLLLTFTNKAASEMKSRAIAVTPSLSKRINAGTFHSFCMSVLRSHGSQVGIDQNFEILHESEAQELAEQVSHSTGGTNHAKAWRTNRLRLRKSSAEVAAFGSSYESLKRSQGVVDFDDLIVKCAQLFEEKPAIAKAYATKYQHIMIDEFQDTNAAQFSIVKALASRAPASSTIAVFADDDQAIFGFAGADSKNVMVFCDQLKAEIFPLTTNHRCLGEIVAVANRLIRANRKDGREMKAAKDGGTVEARVFDDLQAEARGVAIAVRKRIDVGTPPEHISILVRSGNRALALKDELVKKQVPFSDWLLEAYNAKETQTLRLCLSVVRPVMSSRVCRKLCDLIGLTAPKDEVVKVQELLAGAKSTKGIAQLQSIRQLVDQGAKVSKIVSKACDFIHTIGDDLGCLDSLVQEVEAFEDHDPEYSLEHLLAHLALGGKTGAPTQGGGVKLASIHRTKGLQWPIVYLVGLEHGTLPDFRAEEPHEVQDERRMCFVGVCRAESSLILTRVATYKGFTKDPSPFLEEMGI